MHAKNFQEPKGDTIWTKHQEDQRVTRRCEKPKSCPNYIRESIQHKIDSKVHQVNKANTNEHKWTLKHTCPMTYLILRIESKIKKRDSHSPKESKVPTNKPNSPLFYDGTLSTKNKKICLPTITNTNWNKSHEYVIENIGELPQD
jgi:hypothetical protein